MNEDKLEQALARVSPQNDPERSRAVLESALAAYDEGGEVGLQAGQIGSARRALGMVALAMHGPLRKAAAAGILLSIAVAAGLLLLSRPSLTLADVQKAFEGQKWVHVRCDDGQEQWYNLAEDKVFFRGSDGHAVVIDNRDGSRLFYMKETGYISADKIQTFAQPSTPWEAVVGPLEQAPRSIPIEKHQDSLDGRQVVRFDVYAVDALGKRLLTLQIWADPATRLPVRTRRMLQYAERIRLKREYVTGDYDFPALGPSSIYNLGVARNTPVVRQDVPVNEEVQQLVNAANAAGARFPRKYRVVVWKDRADSEVDVIYRNEERLRYDHYFMSTSSARGVAFPRGGTAEQVLEWAAGAAPVQSELKSDGKGYSLSASPYPDDSGKMPQPTIQVWDVRQRPLSAWRWPPEAQWDYVGQARHMQPLAGAEGLPPDCITLRSTTGNTQRDYYIDVAHDYTCVRNVWWEKRGNIWKKEREYQLSDFTSLPSGQWYPTRMKFIGYGDPLKNIGASEENSSVKITVLEDADFPPDIFSGEKLFKGAKVVTY